MFCALVIQRTRANVEDMIRFPMILFFFFSRFLRYKADLIRFGTKIFLPKYIVGFKY